ncbi:MAG: GNAT family acetyltransferase [Cohaesibacter sp.]|jgi:GNAT superfamily N-acetyltransferase|nr:GNAT family acetyltransferase [Cohaesibacter sp.]
MLSLEFCEIKDEDVNEVIALWQACGLTRPWNDPYNDIAFARAKPTSTLLVGRDSQHEDGAILASVMVGHDGHRGWVYYLSVSPDHRAEGLGRQTMDAAENWQLSQGVWKMQLLVRGDNHAVLQFYDQLGYQPSSCKLMEKWIDPSKRGD